MVGESKILTVSYGTFSCTLEGFDEPFSTMKAIAEYFRDLAAGDRYFGAEPPQPDTEMLHKIAEQTIQARVNAEVADNSLILRQAEADADAVPAAAVAAPVAAAALVEDAAPVAEAPVAEAPAENAPIDFASYEAAPAAADGDSIAAKLKRIRAVVTKEAAEPAPYSEDEHAEEFTAPAEDTADAESYEEDALDVEPAAEETAEVEAELPEVEAAVPEEISEAPVEDAVAEEPEAEELETVDLEEEPAAPVVDEVEAEDTQDDSDMLARLAGVDTDVEPETVEVEEVAEEATAPTEDLSDDVLANLMVDTHQEEDLVADEAEPVLEAAPTLEDEDNAEEADMATEAEVDLDPETDEIVEDDDIEAVAAQPRRRIIVQKITRADVEAAQAKASGDVSEEPVVEEEDAALSDEAEAALMRELAEVEEETADVDLSEENSETKESADDIIFNEKDIVVDEATMEDAELVEEASEADSAIAETVAVADAETQEENRAARVARRDALQDEDEALDRLMDATSTRFEEDGEGAVRRASIAHLKAAVAATKADDTIAEAAAQEEERELDQYRDDLARVVRPGRARPRAEGARTDRPAPLVLVSEQRIDDPVDEDAVAAADVRPRRISTGNLALQEEMEEEVDLVADAGIESFAEYAARYSALELPDLLEAAAAHYTYVEELPRFTRPMLMRKIASLSAPESFSREEGLRSFGTLLRQGILVKGKDGKFVIAENSRFTPEAL